jgi:hypothetical protein
MCYVWLPSEGPMRYVRLPSEGPMPYYASQIRSKCPIVAANMDQLHPVHVGDGRAAWMGTRRGKRGGILRYALSLLAGRIGLSMLDQHYTGPHFNDAVLRVWIGATLVYMPHV